MFGQLINPAMAINVIRKQCEKQTKEKIGKFQIKYFSESDKLFFNLNEKDYIFESEMFKSSLKAQVSTTLKKGTILDAILLDISNDNKIDAKVLYSFEGKKEFINYKL